MIITVKDAVAGTEKEHVSQGMLNIQLVISKLE